MKAELRYFLEDEKDIRKNYRYPPHLEPYIMSNDRGYRSVHVMCRVCGRSTGRTDSRPARARFLKAHKGCGFSAGKAKVNITDV